MTDQYLAARGYTARRGHPWAQMYCRTCQTTRFFVWWIGPTPGFQRVCVCEACHHVWDHDEQTVLDSLADDRQSARSGMTNQLAEGH